MKKIVGFLAGSKVYQKKQEDLLTQEHYRKMQADFIQKLAEIKPPKGFNGFLSEMAR